MLGTEKSFIFRVSGIKRDSLPLCELSAGKTLLSGPCKSVGGTKVMIIILHLAITCSIHWKMCNLSEFKGRLGLKIPVA